MALSLVPSAAPRRTIGACSSSCRESRTTAGVRPAGIRVLVVENEPQVHAYFREVLAASGCETVGASGVVEALRELDAEAFDVMVLDLRLTDGDGLEVLRRRGEGARSVPVVVVTAFPQDLETMDVAALGIVSTHIKPIQPQTLADAVLKAARSDTRGADATIWLISELERALALAHRARANGSEARRLGARALIQGLYDLPLSLPIFLAAAGVFAAVARGSDRGIPRALRRAVRAIKTKWALLSRADPAVLRAVAEFDVSRDHPVTRAEIARILGLSVTEASRRLYKRAGFHLADVRRAAAIRRIVRPLAISDRAIKSLAVDAGFNDPSHFVRAFERVFLLTPTDFRDLVRSHLRTDSAE